MAFWLVKLNKTWERNKQKEKYLKNVIAHYKIQERYIRIYKSALNYWVVETSILNCFAETIIELENNLRRIKVVSKITLEMHPHISVYKEPLKNNSPSLLLFEVEETERNLSPNSGRWNYKQNFTVWRSGPQNVCLSNWTLIKTPAIHWRRFDWWKKSTQLWGISGL